MENIKLSYFKGVSKFIFVDKAFSKVADKLEGKELEFYNIDLETINKIQADNVEDNKFIYKLVSVISNVETDVTAAEFNKMVMYPSLEFSSYIELLLEHYKDMFENAKKMVKITNKTEKFIQKETGKNIKLEEFIKLAKEETKVNLNKVTEDNLCTVSLMSKECNDLASELKQSTATIVEEIEKND